eukprot:88537-Prorocentrum_minimum.AAC.1
MPLPRRLSPSSPYPAHHVSEPREAQGTRALEVESNRFSIKSGTAGCRWPLASRESRGLSLAPASLSVCSEQALMEMCNGGGNYR